MKGYDLAISFHQEQRKKSVVSGFARVVDRCTDAGKKVAWLHYDPATVDLDSEYNINFYDKMDRVVCVSKSLMETFATQHPEISNKMEYCYNFMSYDAMKENSNAPMKIPYAEGKFICFSACRLVEVKALPRAINAMAESFKNNQDVMWFIAGDGPEKEKINRVIKEQGLEEQIIMLGNQSNPYPYMKNADLLLNVSYHEAAPMVFFESKALGTPIMATRTSSAEELLCDGVDSFICENSEEGIRRMFSRLISHRELVESAKKELTALVADNIKTIEQFEKITELNNND